METQFNQAFYNAHLFLENYHKEKIAKAKLKFQQEKENEKRLSKKN
jgi:hypothetical protein